MNLLIIENIETINLPFYFIDNFEKIYVSLIKLIDFNNVNKLKYKIIFMQTK